jgi:hypothetical protein
MKKTVHTFNGHIVHCTDKDSGDQFNVEVLMHESLKDSDLMTKAEKAAKNSELCQLSGNTFEAEYLHRGAERSNIRGSGTIG